MINEEFNSSIIRCARRIEKFQSNGLMIGFENARNRIEAWVKNFENLLDDLTPLISVIEKISFIPDETVLHQCLDFHKKHIDFSGKERFYTCLGAETESSSRIMRQLNNEPNYAPNIQTLLRTIRERRALNPAIVFIDDFLNSGGQLSTILNSWCKKDESYSPADKARSRKYDKRSCVDKASLKLLKSCSLHFIYLNGMAKGVEKSRRTIGELGLEGDAYILNTYSDEIGVFGSRDDISHIRNHIPVPVSPESIFSDMPCDKLSPLLTIFENTGRALLKANKPQWPDGRIENRILGYGNSAKLFISQTNIPTCTMTCLWSGGHIEIEGKQIDWVPLIKRTEKKIGGSENKDDGIYHCGASNPTARPTDNFSDLGSVALDLKPGTSPPLDMTIFTSAPLPVTNLSDNLWKNATNRYADLFEPDIAEYLGLNTINSLTFVKELRPEVYSQFNSSIVFYLDKDKIPLKIKSIQMITFGGLVSFIGIRFQFKGTEITLKDAIEINYHLPINKNNKTKGPILRIKNTPVEELINWIYSVATVNERIAFPMMDKSIHPGFIRERFMAFTFVREGSGIFDQNRRIADIAFHLMAGFSKPVKTELKKAADYKSMELDTNALVSLSRKGATVLCGGNSGQNGSYLHDHFQKRYFFLYLLVLHLHHLTRSLPLQRIQNEKLAQKTDKWLNLFNAFPYGKTCQKKYMNRFLETLAYEMGVLKNVPSGF